MANPVIQQLIDQVNRNTQLEASATQMINGIAAQVQVAVQQALANGASQQELQPLNDLVTQLQSRATDLSAAITANTPAQP